MNDYPTNMTLRPIHQWPGELTRTRRASAFSAKFSDTLELLRKELRLLEPQSRYYPKTVLQIAMDEKDFRLDGMPRAGAKAQHPGVILTIYPNAKEASELTFPCDTFLTWQDNLRAIALTLEALRKVNRYGCPSRDNSTVGGEPSDRGRPCLRRWDRSLPPRFYGRWRGTATTTHMTPRWIACAPTPRLPRTCTARRGRTLTPTATAGTREISCAPRPPLRCFRLTGYPSVLEFQHHEVVAETAHVVSQTRHQGVPSTGSCTTCGVAHVVVTMEQHVRLNHVHYVP